MSHFVKLDDGTVACVETGVQYWHSNDGNLHMQVPGQSIVVNPDANGTQFAKIVALVM